MTGGYAGKILRVNLTKKSISTMDTEQYEEYGGGHGIGSAIFWDLAAISCPLMPSIPGMWLPSWPDLFPASLFLRPADDARCKALGAAGISR